MIHWAMIENRSEIEILQSDKYVLQSQWTVRLDLGPDGPKSARRAVLWGRDKSNNGLYLEDLHVRQLKKQRSVKPLDLNLDAGIQNQSGNASRWRWRGCVTFPNGDCNVASHATNLGASIYGGERNVKSWNPFAGDLD